MQTLLAKVLPAVFTNAPEQHDNVEIVPVAMLSHTPDLLETRQRLINHPLYRQVDSIDKLRLFMEDHVFAVWDFMSLTKRLQQELTSVTLPWQQPQDASMARFINEIVLGEESDEGINGVPISHMALYLEAMREIGADTKRFERFAACLAQGDAASAALAAAEVPEHVKAFVLHTLDCAISGETIEVIASFLYGREDVIPLMFERLLSAWDGRHDQVPNFAYYLERHIELDGDDHGPAARRMLVRYADDNDQRWHDAAQSATRAIEARINLWDSVLATILAKS